MKKYTQTELDALVANGEHYFEECDLSELVVRAKTWLDVNRCRLEGATVIGDVGLCQCALDGADLSGLVGFDVHPLQSALAAAKLPFVVPVVDDLDAKILAQVESEPDTFDMDVWHSSCGTAHCLAGWAVHLAGKAGYALEEATIAEDAGALIYAKSTGSVPDFYADNEEALAELRARVADRKG